MWSFREWRSTHRSLDDIAHVIDERGHTHDLIRTALCIETGRSVGSDALAASILADAERVLPGVVHHADTPVRVPRSVWALLAVALVVAVLVVLLPAPGPGQGPEQARASPDAGAAEVTAAAPSLDGQRPPTEAPASSGASDRATSESAVAAGRDLTSNGGAETLTSPGLTGGAGDRAAGGTAEAATASGDPTAGTGGASGDARAGGSAGVADGTSSTSSAERAPTGSGDAVTPTQDVQGSGEDGNTTGMVDQTEARTDAVQSNADTLTLQEGTPDDHDAQTRAVAGTLELNSSRPQFFDATEEADSEQDGKGGAGGWTIGLSQPGEGGVNDATGSTWKTEAGLPDPPDWTDAPAEWVDAAWQDSPAGVVRRVQSGQAGGGGSMPYAEAWHRYAAVAEADTSAAELGPGRQALIRQYFLAIAPSESP